MNNLFHERDLDEDATDMLQLFMKRLERPICLIARNGRNLDAILQFYAPRWYAKGGPLYCADSMALFEELDKKLYRLADVSPAEELVHRYSVSAVYHRIFNAHSVEGDCSVMMSLVHNCGLPALEWLEVNSTDFNVSSSSRGVLYLPRPQIENTSAEVSLTGLTFANL